MASGCELQKYCLNICEYSRLPSFGAIHHELYYKIKIIHNFPLEIASVLCHIDKVSTRVGTLQDCLTQSPALGGFLREGNAFHPSSLRRGAESARRGGVI